MAKYFFFPTAMTRDDINIYIYIYIKNIFFIFIFFGLVSSKPHMEIAMSVFNQNAAIAVFLPCIKIYFLFLFF